MPRAVATFLTMFANLVEDWTILLFVFITISQRRTPLKTRRGGVGEGGRKRPKKVQAVTKQADGEESDDDAF